MPTRQSLEQLKEQLRRKNVELKKLDADRAKQESKIKHLMTVSGKKISEMQQRLEEKEEQIRYQKSLRRTNFSQPGNLTNEPISLKTQPKSEVKDEITVKDKESKLKKQIKELLIEFKKKNGRLIKKINIERVEKEKLIQERSLLEEELKKYRNESAPIDQIKEQAKYIDTASEEFQGRFKEILNEKDALIESYEKLIQESVENESDLEFSGEIVGNIRQELNKVKEEKDELEKELNLQKRQFEATLSHEIRSVKESFKRKKNKVNKKREKVIDSIEEIQEDKTSNAWITTYADMTTLLLTFFVLYYSLASINMNKFKEAILGQHQASIGLLELLDAVESKDSIDALTGLKTNDILSEVKHVAEDETLNSVMDVSTDSSKIIITVPGQTLFKPGSADLQIKSSRPVLDELIRIISKYPKYKINIQGHTDDSPISTDKFPSNWELSAARATAVLRYFIDKNINPKRVTATGYADIFPVASNSTELGQATNRRVEFVLEKEK